MIESVIIGLIVNFITGLVKAGIGSLTSEEKQNIDETLQQLDLHRGLDDQFDAAFVQSLGVVSSEDSASAIRRLAKDPDFKELLFRWLSATPAEQRLIEKKLCEKLQQLLREDYPQANLDGMLNVFRNIATSNSVIRAKLSQLNHATTHEMLAEVLRKLPEGSPPASPLLKQVKILAITAFEESDAYLYERE